MFKGALLVNLCGKGHSQDGGGGAQMAGCWRWMWTVVMVVGAIKDQMDGARRGFMKGNSTDHLTIGA